MKYKILEALYEANDYISDESLGNMFEVSKNIICKEITELKQEGYNINLVENKGYILREMTDILNSFEIKYGLETKNFGKDIYFYDELNSTNDKMCILAKNGAKEGTVVIAQTQSAGKGRRGHIWKSPKNTGIYMSILMYPNISPRQAPKITLIAGLCVCKAIRKITGIKAVIKWPNDLLINGRKVCGILTEMNAGMEKVNFIVLGIGINVNTNSFPKEIENIATSLKIEGNKNYIRKTIIQEFLKEFEEYYYKYIEDTDFKKFVKEYKNFCSTIGQKVNVISNNSFSGLAVDVTDDGELVVEKENGDREIVFSGEVSVRSASYE